MARHGAGLKSKDKFMYKIWEEYPSGLTIESTLLGKAETPWKAYILAKKFDDIRMSSHDNCVRISKNGNDDYTQSVESLRKENNFVTLYLDDGHLLYIDENGLRELDEATPLLMKN